MNSHRHYPQPAQKPRPVLAVLLPTLAMMASLFVVSISSPSSVQFYIATVCSAGALTAAWWLFGDHRVWGEKPWLHLAQGIGIGALLAGIFSLGAVIISNISFLATPVNDLLANAAGAALLPTLFITLVNGAAEELFFRNTVLRHLAHWGRWAIPASIGLHVVATIAMQVPLLALAALTIGVFAQIEVHRTRALTSAIALHLSWSTIMIVALPLLL